MLGGAKLKFEPRADSNIGGATPPQKGLMKTLNYRYTGTCMYVHIIYICIHVHVHVCMYMYMHTCTC